MKNTINIDAASAAEGDKKNGKRAPEKRTAGSSTKISAPEDNYARDLNHMPKHSKHANGKDSLKFPLRFEDANGGLIFERHCAGFKDKAEFVRHFFGAGREACWRNLCDSISETGKLSDEEWAKIWHKFTEDARRICE